MGSALSEAPDDALTAAMELKAFLDIENRNSTHTLSVNQVAQSVLNESLEEIVRCWVKVCKTHTCRATKSKQAPTATRTWSGHVHWAMILEVARALLGFILLKKEKGTNILRSDIHNPDNCSSRLCKKRNEHRSKKSASKHCKRTNDESEDWTTCFNCRKSGHFGRGCRSKRNVSSN